MLDYIVQKIKSLEYKHTFTCPVCLNDVSLFRKRKERVKTCSKICKLILRSKTTSEILFLKYGVTNVSQLDHIKDKKSTTRNIDKEIKDISAYNKGRETRLDRYGDENYRNPDKAKETCIERYGITNVTYLPNHKENRLESCIKKYGCDSNQHPEVIQKQKETLFKNFSVTSASHVPHFNIKFKETSFKKYGYEHPIQSPIIREKIITTNRNKYGCDYPIQSPDYNPSYRGHNYKCSWKNYIFPSGKTVLVQGYEPRALDELLKIYKEDEIYTQRKDVPRISYIFNDKISYYFPDIWIPKDNLIIEVKSPWTFQLHFNRVMTKYHFALENGYNFNFIIYKQNGDKIQFDNFIKPYLSFN